MSERGQRWQKKDDVIWGARHERTGAAHSDRELAQLASLVRQADYAAEHNFWEENRPRFGGILRGGFSRIQQMLSAR